MIVVQVAVVTAVVATAVVAIAVVGPDVVETAVVAIDVAVVHAVVAPVVVDPVVVGPLVAAVVVVVVVVVVVAWEVDGPVGRVAPEVCMLLLFVPVVFYRARCLRRCLRWFLFRLGGYLEMTRGDMPCTIRP